MTTPRVADRTNQAPDHRGLDDVPLPGTEDLTPLDDNPPHTHATGWCAERGPRPCSCWDDGEGAPVDLDRLGLTVAPRAVIALDGQPVTSRTPHGRYL